MLPRKCFAVSRNILAVTTGREGYYCIQRVEANDAAKYLQSQDSPYNKGLSINESIKLRSRNPVLYSCPSVSLGDWCRGFQNPWMLKPHSQPSISAGAEPMDTEGLLYNSDDNICLTYFIGYCLDLVR